VIVGLPMNVLPDVRFSPPLDPLVVEPAASGMQAPASSC
jgi:hypothetical protein